jgi:agmatinase
VNENKIPDNFGGLSSQYSSYKNARIVILPAPFDKTSSWIKGSSKGPSAIIHASKHMELYDIETGTEVYTRGIHTAKAVVSANSKTMINKVQRKVHMFLEDGKFITVLGGEHTVSLGSIKAHAERFKNLSILHLDAHSDTRDSYDGNKFSHACVMARVKEFNEKIISVGIRSMDSSELERITKRNIFYASDIRKSGNWINKAVQRLSSNVYVTVDLDVFDPSIMPSTGTPEPGGMGWYQVLELLESVSKKKTAKLVYKLLSFIFS